MKERTQGILFIAFLLLIFGTVFIQEFKKDKLEEPSVPIEIVEDEPEVVIPEEPEIIVVPQVPQEPEVEVVPEEPEVIIEPKTEEEIQQGREDICNTGRITMYLLEDMEATIKEEYPDNKGLLETINENGDIGFSDGTVVFKAKAGTQGRYEGLGWDLRNDHTLAFVEFYNNYLAK